MTEQTDYRLISLNLLIASKPRILECTRFFLEVSLSRWIGLQNLLFNLRCHLRRLSSYTLRCVAIAAAPGSFLPSFLSGRRSLPGYPSLDDVEEYSVMSRASFDFEVMLIDQVMQMTRAPVDQAIFVIAATIGSS
jgi:hypothetical protein